jgi:hypothetical protein
VWDWGKLSTPPAPKSLRTTTEVPRAPHQAEPPTEEISPTHRMLRARMAELAEAKHRGMSAEGREPLRQSVEQWLQKCREEASRRLAADLPRDQLRADIDAAVALLKRTGCGSTLGS